MIRKRITKSNGTKKTAEGYEVDGLIYKSKVLAEYHKELKANKNVKTFHLPELSEDKKARNGKYNSYKVSINDITFDSIMESRFYLLLLSMQADKEVTAFKNQVTFELQPKFKDKYTGKNVRAITYIADFVVTMSDGRVIAVDVKGKETDVFKIKRKIFMYKYPDIELVCMRFVSKSNIWLTVEEIKKGK